MYKCVCTCARASVVYPVVWCRFRPSVTQLGWRRLRLLWWTDGNREKEREECQSDNRKKRGVFATFTQHITFFQIKFTWKLLGYLWHVASKCSLTQPMWSNSVHPGSVSHQFVWYGCFAGSVLASYDSSSTSFFLISKQFRESLTLIFFLRKLRNIVESNGCFVKLPILQKYAPCSWSSWHDSNVYKGLSFAVLLLYYLLLWHYSTHEKV